MPLSQLCSPSPPDNKVNAVVPRAGAPPCILGDCTIKLSHATTYEPPLYLFPELLPRVAQGAPPVSAWDAVADAIDVAASSWTIADVRSLAIPQDAALDSTASPTVALGPNHRKPTTKSVPVTTLASLIASNRLLMVGLTPQVLTDGNFSAAAIVGELLQLKDRAGLSDAEGAVVMSNHFVNLLAWKKLREVNHTAAPVGASASSSRKRVRERDILDTLRACPDPWSTDTDDALFAGEFISGREEDVEQQVELLDTLAKLYRRPWRQLRSQGVQTDHVVPPGTVNVTSPYADPHRVTGGATLDVVDDLGWTAAAGGTLELMHPPSPYALVITSDSVDGAGAHRVLLSSPVTTFGATAGAQRTITGAVVDIAVGLRTFTSQPTLLSSHHLSILLRKDFRPRHSSGDEGGDPPSPATEGGRSPECPAQPVHLKTPTGYTVWVINYGRNGARVGSRWVHGAHARLHVGEAVELAGGVRMTLVTNDDASAAATVKAEIGSNHPTSVKQELSEE